VSPKRDYLSRLVAWLDAGLALIEPVLRHEIGYAPLAMETVHTRQAAPLLAHGQPGGAEEAL